MTRQRRYQIAHKAAGLCVTCTAPLVTRNHCAQHAAMVNAAAERYQARVCLASEVQYARNALNYAVRSGRVQRPTQCSQCRRTDPKITAHHPDYRHPLAVVWLCYPCHKTLELDATRSAPCATSS